MIDPTKYSRLLQAGLVPASSAVPGRTYLTPSGYLVQVYAPSRVPEACGRKPQTGGVPYKRLPVEDSWLSRPSYGWLPCDYPLQEVRRCA